MTLKILTTLVILSTIYFRKFLSKNGYTYQLLFLTYIVRSKRRSRVVVVFSLYIFSYAYVIFGYAKKNIFAVLFSTSNRGEVGQQGMGSGILLLGFFRFLLGFNWVVSVLPCKWIGFCHNENCECQNRVVSVFGFRYGLKFIGQFG